jgi:hypothetical protein
MDEYSDDSHEYVDSVYGDSDDSPDSDELHEQYQASLRGITPPLVVAATKGDVETVLRLLDEEGVPVDVCDTWEEVEWKWFGGYEKSWTWNKDSALCGAVRNGHTSCVAALLEHGADKAFRVCLREDVHETPLTIAESVSDVHHECSMLILKDSFDEKLSRVTARYDEHRGGAPSLFQLACKQLRVCGGLLRVFDEEFVASHEEKIAFSSWSFWKEIAEPSALDMLPEGTKELLSKEVVNAWLYWKKRIDEGDKLSNECLELSRMFLKGYGTVADGMRGMDWLMKSMQVDDGEMQRSLFHVRKKKEAWEDLFGASAKYHTPALLQRFQECLEGWTSSLLPSPSEKIVADARKMVEDRRQETDRKRKRDEEEEKRAQRQKIADEYDAIRAREVERCKEFECERSNNPRFGGHCRNRQRHNHDYCTYGSHSDDLPLHCLWFSRGKCTNGDDCWYNHMPLGWSYFKN